jgi:pyruvate formate lyase activating enzyme
MELLESDFPYMQGGGVTFSGGECMLQPFFMKEAVNLCRAAGIHTAVDTAGHVPYEWLTDVNPDLFLYDIKALSPELHNKLTGVDGVLIWENLRRLLTDGFAVRVRIPCVPEANINEIPGIQAKLNEWGVRDIDLLPYHDLGKGKRVKRGFIPR